MFLYQKQTRYFAQTAGGFEEPVAAELGELGAQRVKPAFRGVHFEADPATLYRINYCSRLSMRILAPLISFDCHSDRYLYKTARGIDWSLFMNPNQTLAVHAVTSNTPGLRHSQYAALKLKDAVCDVFRDQCGERPSINVHHPDLGIHLFVRNNRAVISIDTSGESLHRRGYRRDSVDAPMSETLAAAVIRLSGWDGERPLIDPMCGSGTLLCEAAMQFCRIPAGHLRSRWGFERLPDFNSEVWKTVKAEADAPIRPLPAGLIAGSDIDPRAVRAARANLNRLPGCSGQVHCLEKNVFEIPTLGNTTLVINPPYGVRLGERAAAEGRMKDLGDFLKQRCTGCTALIYAGDRNLLKKVGLKPAWKKELNNGGLAGILGKYDLY